MAVVFGVGGREPATSCVRADSVVSHLDRNRFDVVPVGVTSAGSWLLGVAEPLSAGPPRDGLLDLGLGRAGEVWSGVDVAFPVLHGPIGEHGTVQGLLEMAGLPYVGAGVLASAAGMDRELGATLVAADGLPVGDLVVLRPGAVTLTRQQRARLGLPVVVKPARVGSSVGTTRVTDWVTLDAAIATARVYDPKVLVEAVVVGRVVECGVLELPDGSVRVSVTSAISEPGHLDARCLDGDGEPDIPAELDDAVSERLREMAVAAFHALDGQGLATVGLVLGPDGELTVDEVDTRPVLTPTSTFPRAWAGTGLDLPTLLTTMVDTALARGTGLR